MWEQVVVEVVDIWWLGCCQLVWLHVNCSPREMGWMVDGDVDDE
jgi:hypothetical protein